MIKMFTVTSMMNFKSYMAVTYFKVILLHLPGKNKGYPELIIGIFLITGRSYRVGMHIPA
jgi:hypothetical protein